MQLVAFIEYFPRGCRPEGAEDKGKSGLSLLISSKLLTPPPPSKIVHESEAWSRNVIQQPNSTYFCQTNVEVKPFPWDGTMGR